jgi:hypothetical protein
VGKEVLVILPILTVALPTEGPPRDEFFGAYPIFFKPDHLDPLAIFG